MTIRAVAFTVGLLAAAFLVRRLWRRMIAIHDAHSSTGSLRRGYYQSTIEPK